ncbi:MAG: hypothetical protein AB8W78_06685 [Arsenophonus endosymbiont of Dermacentor nuttalli]
MLNMLFFMVINITIILLQSKNNYIYFSHGIDIYLLEDLASTDKINDSITFDFKEINASFTNEDIFIIVVKEYSGYDFIFEGNSLSYQASSQ